MKQLGLAFHNYHDTYKKFPAYSYPCGSDPTSPYRSYSAFVQILSFVEQSTLFDLVATQSGNFNAAAYGVTAGKTKVSAFKCPSDSEFPGNYAGMNYAVSLGSTTRYSNLSQQNGMFRGEGGKSDDELGMKDVTDGLSNTLLVSEQLVGDDNDNAIITGDTSELLFATSAVSWSTFPTQADIDAVGASLPTGAARLGDSYQNSSNGREWMCGLPAQTAINTLAPPNWKYNNCQFSGSGFAADRDGIYTPRSRHPGGVLVAAGDGSSRFISETIDLTTWQNFGARNDGNVVQLQ
ncbi:DUF1559 domain-containing protein [Blastopirellula sp. JC732]|uniref:DUF1559 domain-containing protein n=2 Tax=Blastopirellula sediminis TaxID=2894196 RepID=A0A9X1SHM3_9BACT|nr:DUF1559 domain-containing protein [Blastopirellula sediminis]MCC9630583.1 DUF1559 domain-containing protein [Blastopirellula sediminis]